MAVILEIVRIKIILESLKKLINLLKKTDKPDIEGLNNILNSLGEECLMMKFKAKLIMTWRDFKIS